jgi:hypothetical protein
MSVEIQTNPRATARRIKGMEQYMATHVMASKRFLCAQRRECRRSAEAQERVRFFACQLSYVGRHYDANVGGKSFQSWSCRWTGIERRHITMRERDIEGVRPRIHEDFAQRNPHMRGVTLALRLAYGTGLGDDREGEWLLTKHGPVHVLDVYSMANAVLCSAIVPRKPPKKPTLIRTATKSRVAGVMQTNCLEHLAATIRILEPTLVIGQGNAAEWAVSALLSERRRVRKGVWMASAGDSTFIWVPLFHPSSWGPTRWDRPTCPYARETVKRTITAARKAAFRL